MGVWNKKKKNQNKRGLDKKRKRRDWHVGDWILQLLFPRRCPFCDEPIPGGAAYVCVRCEKKIRVIREPYCYKCGKPVESGEKEYCRDCRKYGHVFERGRALLLYSGEVKASIYRFKYAGRKEYAKAYAALVMQELSDYFREVDANAIVPVPLHKKRYQKRGYNQAELLAREIGRYTSLPVLPQLVTRTRDTLPQKQLDRGGRQNNLKKAFKINGNDVKLNTIILIDDIYTTGSTMDAIAQVLRDAGVKQIFFLTISCGE